ncbi:hypothetical protein Ahy_A04g017300 [Arachis hypogaea]|uniref:F-box associated domain-containing protein n=1 Tax=Arachis hypogaea TaxID=3818 RepID=A0A445DAM8_ARAHY|nr:hypothetical protein Ahy_A04g017300 [Arachis hypogaea]
MKEYKLHSSWTLYQIPCENFRLLCLSNNGDITVEQFIWDKEKKKKFLIYNVGGQLLPRVKYYAHNISATDAMYKESLLTLPSDINKKKKENSMSSSSPSSLASPKIQTKKENEEPTYKLKMQSVKSLIKSLSAMKAQIHT